MPQPRRIAPSTFIIVTRNRPDHLAETVKSVLKQTVLPSEICIVDSSTVAVSRDEVLRLCAETGVQSNYVHPSPVGCTVQRNLGIRVTNGDPVFFIDDDVALEERCHELVLEEYKCWDDRLGGVTVTPIGGKHPKGVGLVYRRLFGLGGLLPNGRGKVLPGFWGEAIAGIQERQEVEFFYGWFMSYRRVVLEAERFDEVLAGYGYKEDLDFSFRVSRRWVLMQLPDARCAHLNAPSSRPPSAQLRRQRLANHFYLHRKLMPRGLKYKAALWWGLAGLLIQDIALSLRQRDMGIVAGFLAGVWDHFRRRDLSVPRGGDDSVKRAL